MFTVDWFSNNIPRWERHVKPRFADKKMKALVIGCHEGRAPLWILDNCPRSSVVCVDEFNERPVFERLKKNVSGYGDRAKWIKGSFRDALIELKNEHFDFIFIATIDSKVVLEAMVLAFPLLKARGLMIADNYTHSKEHIPNCPRIGVDSFMTVYARYVKALEYSWQAIFLKRSKPLKVAICKSEYYHENISKI
jgi:predicted O-methyltransferase YrrM